MNKFCPIFQQYEGYGHHHGFRPYGNPANPPGDHHRDRGERAGRIKNLDEIVCFKCGENGHFANRCTKGHLAFLSANAGRRNANQERNG